MRRGGMKRLVLWVPLGLFGLFAIMVTGRLRRADDNTIIPSQMVGKPVPDFALPGATAGHKPLAAADLRDGRPHLVNVFASWCLPCKAEAPQLVALRQRGVAIEGVAVRDRPEDVAGFLAQGGDPFDRIGADRTSRVQFALGSSGVPESFIVDGRGIIRSQHIGDIRPEQVDDIVQAYEAAR
jgi:cytochrome c biogenesis protein CcmG/thiol:disulfide interchange protein DsbE